MIWKWSKRTHPRYLRSVKKNTSKTTDATRRCTFSTRLPSYPHPIIQSHALLSPSPRNHPTRPPLHPQRAKPSTVTSQPRVQTSLRFPFERPVHVVALSPVALDVWKRSHVQIIKTSFLKTGIPFRRPAIYRNDVQPSKAQRKGTVSPKKKKTYLTYSSFFPVGNKMRVLLWRLLQFFFFCTGATRLIQRH